MVVGNGNYAYIDFQKDATEFSLIKKLILKQEIIQSRLILHKQIYHEIYRKKSLSFDQMSQIYTDNSANEYVALSLSGYNYDKDKYKAYMTLCIYNLTQNKNCVHQIYK